MTELAEVLEIKVPDPHRFGPAEMTSHSEWILNRLIKKYPNQNTRSVIGWLNGVIDNNEFLCLALENSVAFFERVAVDRLSGKMIVREIFVWAKDPENVLQQREAATFYEHAANWAKYQQIDRVIVLEASDVPEAEVRKIFQRLHEIKTHFVRI